MAPNREMEFCLLGPLQVRRDGITVRVPTGMQQSLLAALLLRANTMVSVDELARALWGPTAPPSARASLQNTVLRLRRSLGDAGHSRIVAQPGGYQITVEPGELDVERFEALLMAAWAAHRTGSDAEAATLGREALSLWRGQPLAGISSDLLALRDVPRLEEMQLQALEACIDADLRVGRHAEAIIELRQLVAENPLRERLHALLILALYRDGRRAEALAAYQSARNVLADELGVEPGSELRRVQQQILVGHPDDPKQGTSRPAKHLAAVVPRQLPAATPFFTGRAAEMAELTRLLPRAGVGTGVVICVIAGTAGIGKTALAVHWAHEVAHRFPDGQLYVNLQGFGPSRAPMTPAEAVRLFLDGLGVAPERIPADLDAQAALYRSLLPGKQILIVLDNARDPAQVRPLLPGSPGCMVLVTSRSRLTGLAAAEGAQLLTLDLLTDPEAREMLTLRLTPSRVCSELPAVTELTALCARLPLALSIAAARAAARPTRPLAELVAEIRATRVRLDALGTRDAATDMRTVLSWSFRQISQPAAGMFRLLGVHPGSDITIAAAASLAGVPIAHARRAIADLADAHLISEHLPGRFTFHDLLRGYAAEQAHSHDGDADRRAGRHRVLDHYLHTASAASLLLSYRDPITLSPLQPGAVPEQLTGREQALAWFQAERQVLLAAARTAADSGFSMHAWQIPWAMATFLDWFGYWHELVATQQSAVAATQRISDLYGEAEARRQLARGLVRLGEVADAVTHLTAAIELGAQVGDTILQARTHLDLGGVFESQGRVHEALGHAAQAVRLYRETGHRWGEAFALSGMGWAHAQLVRYHDALDFCSQAMAIFRELDIKLGQSATLDSLGYIHHQLGEYAEAISCFQGAITIDGDAGDRRTRAEVLIHLGDSLLATGNRQEALAAWREALAILEAIHGPDPDRVRSRISQQEHGVKT
jgi:DNA-binding SARP family transcriptional activator